MRSRRCSRWSSAAWSASFPASVSAGRRREQAAPSLKPMAKNLVIVESPAKAKTLGKYLGRNYQVKASVGHVVDLPKSKLGVDIDKDFAADYHVITGKAKIVADIKAA